MCVRSSKADLEAETSAVESVAMDLALKVCVLFESGLKYCNYWKLGKKNSSNSSLESAFGV